MITIKNQYLYWILLLHNNYSEGYIIYIFYNVNLMDLYDNDAGHFNFFIIYFLCTFMHLADAFIQSEKR